MGFDEMEPIFGQINAEWSAPHKTPLKPFLFHVHGLPSDPSTLHVCATDFHSNTWDALKSDFVDYLIAAIKSEDVKLVMDGQSKVGGAAHVKLVAQKAKGMPRISISLSKLVDTAVTEAMANLSLELYTTFTNVHNLLKAEQQRCCELTNVLSEEKQAAQHPSTKVTNRVVPAHRRARVRGVLLHDIAEERQD